MGRRRTTHHGLPPHLARKGQSYYYVTNDRPRRWLPVGSDYGKALIAWAKHEGQAVPECARTFGQIAEWYREEILPTKAARTQTDNEAELKRLEAVFGDSPIETITPVDVATYLANRMARPRKNDSDAQPRRAKTRANREIALLSHVINFARRRGFTEMANPCAGVLRNKEAGRERYVEDEEFDAIYVAGDDLLRDAMDLMLLTSQRPGDVVRMRRPKKLGDLKVRQGKTGTKLRITVEADLAAAIERMQSRERKATGVYLLQDDAGQPLTYWQLEDRFSAARALAALTMPSVADIQMRDIRGKAATDLEDLAHAQELLGHKTRAMTERYVKQRGGDRVAPLRRKLRPKEL